MPLTFDPQATATNYYRQLLGNPNWQMPGGFRQDLVPPPPPAPEPVEEVPTDPATGNATGFDSSLAQAAPPPPAPVNMFEGQPGPWSDKMGFKRMAAALPRRDVVPGIPPTHIPGGPDLPSFNAEGAAQAEARKQDLWNQYGGLAPVADSITKALEAMKAGAVAPPPGQQAIQQIQIQKLGQLLQALLPKLGL